MSTTDTFDTLFLVGRPAAGKSEVIRYLKGLTDHERSTRLHVGPFHEIDDFPMIWSWFEEDEILSRHGKRRLHSDEEGYFLDNFQWHVLIERLELEHTKWRADASSEGATSVIEFARGAEHGGFREAFAHFSPAILAGGAALYIRVSYQESLRKNRRRFNPDKPHSILEHALPDDKLERLYRDSDWDDLAAGDAGYLHVGGARVPYVAFENEDDVTTPGGEPLGRRLSESLGRLWELRRRRGG